MRSVLNEEGIVDLFTRFAADAASKAADKADTVKKGKYYLGGSISKYTKGLLMSFPVLCDDSLSLDSAMNISKANEKNITSMMEMLFASMSINGKQGLTGKDVVAIFHKNIDAMPIDDYIDMANDYASSYLASEAGELLPRVNDSAIREAARDMMEDLRMTQKSFPVSSFNESSISDYMTRDNTGKVIVYEAPQYDDQLARDKFEYEKQRDAAAQAAKDAQNKLNVSKFNYQKARDKAQDARDLQNDINQKLNNQNNFNIRRVLDADFKKANELQPTMLVVNFNVLGEDNKTVIDRSSFIAGIKCRLIATGSLDIAERIISVNKQKLTFKNFIRATTGEIKLTKDLLLAIDSQKIDAKNDAKRGEAARLWNTLKKRSIKGNYRKLSRDGNDASAITTLVVSQDTVNYLKSANKIDLSVPSTALKVMESYNLLCLVIADDANEVAKFIYDGNKNFDSLAYSVLSKEANDKALRRELNLIQQARRF